MSIPLALPEVKDYWEIYKWSVAACCSGLIVAQTWQLSHALKTTHNRRKCIVFVSASLITANALMIGDVFVWTNYTTILGIAVAVQMLTMSFMYI